MSKTAYLGIGSNVEPERHVMIAIERIGQAFEQARFSPIYRSRAVGFEGNDFINLVARVETDLTPLALRDWLRALEDEYGRERNVPKFSDRILDVDILLYGDQVSRADGLELPRPELFHFAHVLRPLAELAPDLVCPGDGRTMRQIREQARLDESSLVALGTNLAPLTDR
jgi:2-amino-4-hydroxy-6-hydroxymethyldihydropteridine diphosphokinase